MIIIKKDSIISLEENKESGVFEEVNILDLEYPFTKYFGQIVEISDDVTVEDFMNHLSEYSEIIDLCFYSYMNGQPFSQYYDLMLTDPDEKYFIDIVEFFWATEVIESEYCMFGTFHGISSSTETKNYEDDNVPTAYPLDLIPINKWKHCRLIINDSLRASSIDEDSNGQILSLRNRWTLFELIQYFLFELMCYGSVDDLKQEIELYEKNKTKYEGFRVDPDFAEKLDKEELLAFVGEIEKQLAFNKEALEIAVQDDDFESATELKKEGDELSIELKKMKNKLKEL